MKALVTGAAGFIGSHLGRALLDAGHELVAIDVFTDYYDTDAKQRNAADAGIDVQRADLRSDDLRPLVDDVDVVFHLAAQPGVRLSWAEGFAVYDAHNVLALQRVLEAIHQVGDDRGDAGPRLVFASSSSIYGNAERYPCEEGDAPHPHSPYGVTKLAGEHLCAAYAENFGTESVALRYFTVYGPRQRPDMAFHRICRAVLDGTPFPLFGDGSQVRDFTYVGDVVAATVAAATAEVPNPCVLNVAGGSSTSMKEIFDLVSRLAGRELHIDRRPAQPGDVRRTGGDTTRARSLLGWEPTVTLEDGLAAQLEWHRSH